MSTPTVSVVIPTRNRAEKCATAVRSALAQSLPPIEILVCDDCSDDETSAEILAIAGTEPSVKLIRGERPSGGPGAPRNRGIAQAMGDFVAFLDDDDRWHPEKLAAQAPLLTAENSIVCTNATRSSGGNYFPDESDRLFSRADLLRENPVIISSAIVPRQRLLREGGFATSGRLAGCADYDMWLRIVGRDDLVFRIGKPLIKYEDSDSERLSNEELQMATAEALAFAHASLNAGSRLEMVRPLANRLALALGAAARHGIRRARTR